MKKIRGDAYFLKLKLILILATMVFLFEQSPLNEAVRAYVGFWVLDFSANPLYVGVSVLLVTLLVEVLTSLFISLGLQHSKHFHSFAARHKNVLGNKSTIGVSIISNGFLALTVGSGIVVIKHKLQNPKTTFKHGFKVGIEAAVWIAVVSGFIAYLASGGVEVARAYGYGGAADAVVKYGSDWRFWFILFIISQGVELIGASMRRKK